MNTEGVYSFHTCVSCMSVIDFKSLKFFKYAENYLMHTRTF